MNFLGTYFVFSSWDSIGFLACCNVGAEPREANEYTYNEIKENHVCVEKSQVGLIVGVTVAGVVVTAIAGYIAMRVLRRRKEVITFNNNHNSSKLSNKHKPPEETKFPITYEDEIVVMPPPTAPQFSGAN